jgi:hypothetical protein
MNANAIYSKSGKGVQEAAGKTSSLSRPDRAVLSAIDGRASLADVAQKVGKPFDAAFEKLIGELDKGGFIRQVSAGTAGAAKPGAAPAKPGAAGKAPDPASDLDVTAALTVPRAKPAPSTQPPPRAAPAAPPPPPAPSAPEKAKAEQIAKQQQDAFTKAREEAEQKAQAERDRVKAEAEAKVKAETEAKLRAEAKEAADKKFAAELEAKTKAEAEAKIKAARDAAAKVAAEAKAKAEAEARKAREEAERVRKEAEEVERKAREEAKRLEEERRKLEEERQRREEELRREEEERAARRKREEEEEQERKRKKREQEEEEERREAAERAERKRRQQEEDEREQAEREARRKAKPKDEEPEAPLPVIEEKPKPKPQPKAPEPAKSAGGFADTLLADLDSFNTREEEERKAKEEAERKEKEEAIRHALEAEEARKKEDAERQAREEKQRRKEEERERKAREEAELREQEEKEKERLKEEEEKRKQEAEERAKKAKQEEQLAARAVGAGSFDAAERARREAALMGRSRPKAGGSIRAEKRGGWGKPIAITLFLLALIAVGVAHVMPIDVSDYQTAATDALRRPVKIGSANLSLVTGLELKFRDVQIGDTRLPLVRAFPEIGSLTGPKKVFSRIEIEGGKLEQGAVGDALFAKVQADTFSVGRIVARNIELAGPLAIPKGTELEANYDAEGNVRGVLVRGPQALLARIARKGESAEFDASASTFTLPFAPEIALSTFSMKGSITPKGMNVQEWDGQTLNGTVSGTANVRWGDNWTVDGVLTARNINAAVFAPALLSDGRGEGSGKFSMRGEPGKLAGTGRIDGTFTVSRGVLGSIDLAKAIQSGGKSAQGRTQFNEMTGQGSYDRGALALRSVTISAGQLNAGASVDISEKGALSGRIVADVKIASQQQRATLLLGGTLQEPLVRN